MPQNRQQSTNAENVKQYGTVKMFYKPIFVWYTLYVYFGEGRRPVRVLLLKRCVFHDREKGFGQLYHAGASADARAYKRAEPYVRRQDYGMDRRGGGGCGAAAQRVRSDHGLRGYARIQGARLRKQHAHYRRQNDLGGEYVYGSAGRRFYRKSVGQTQADYQSVFGACGNRRTRTTRVRTAAGTTFGRRKSGIRKREHSRENACRTAQIINEYK